MKFRVYDVGGFVRDELLGIKSKDRDCGVEVQLDAGEPAPTVDEAFAAMTDWLTFEGFHIFVSTPEHGTIRAHPPRGSWVKDLTLWGTLPADFVLARKEGPYSDGRRPDWVKVGTMADDLARRDFTVNALARITDTGEIVDLHNGKADLDARILRFVGDPMERITEDALRVMRALRFKVTKGFDFAPETLDAIGHPAVPALLAAISEDRRTEELTRMFNFDTIGSMKLLQHFVAPNLLDAIFAGRVRLTGTLKKGTKK